MNAHVHTEHHAHQKHVFDSPIMAASAELEGEVLFGLVTQATSVLGELCDRHGVDVSSILDIGCGPGVGTCYLAQFFDSANVLAVDGSAAMLERVTGRAERVGVARRVRTRHVELPAGLVTLGRADVVWASQVLHHLADEAETLRQIQGLLEPGGLLALVEPASPMRVVPREIALGRPGIWERLDHCVDGMVHRHVGRPAGNPAVCQPPDDPP